MKEKHFQRTFGKKNTLYGVFELKLCKGTSIAFDAVKEHQVDALLAVSSDQGLYHKIADQTIGRLGGFGATLKKPFDCFKIKNIPAYIVIMFYSIRRKKLTYYIPIKNWINMTENANRKSATEKMCEECSELVVNYLKK